ncbi:hypothetical protein ABENE_07770 [Asticcacaulis benevestitus DSM 16100 = ATCC BAA-896]|uniref:Uncharacterized protein n=2 Tax=Asticcacaulis TaxID=76890 RepID=V4Q3U6_9CAUL|nr:hypothetical protein ABENE_07770 [Asticcacaulis benevestitus DSM 16100 = ATCC BAA-896]
MDVALVQPHVSFHPLAKDRPPTVTTISFTPSEMFGAAARCSHLIPVDPTLVTPESKIVKALVREYVDDHSADFAILRTANTLKDYVKGYLAGTVAAGLAYLVMVREGYVWAGHFEILKGGNPASRRRPDFVFAAPGGDIALMESKGSRSYSRKAFHVMVEDGYKGQVEPHIGFSVGGATASHGFSIGSYLKSKKKAEFHIHHTAQPVIADDPVDQDPPEAQSVEAIMRANYATVFSLVHSPDLGRAILRGETRHRVGFIEFDWRGLTWWAARPEERALNLGTAITEEYIFAIEASRARTVLSHFLEPFPDQPDLILPRLPIERFGEESAPEDDSGAIFPDGLAVVSRIATLTGDITRWRSQQWMAAMTRGVSWDEFEQQPYEAYMYTETAAEAEEPKPLLENW